MPASPGEHFHRHMHRSVVARRAVADGAGPFLGVGYEFLQRLPRAVRAHCEHRRIRGEPRDRHQLIELVHRRAADDLVGLGQDRDRRQREEQRIAVGFGLGHVGHADAAARAGLVLDNDRRTKHASHRIRGGPRDDVGDASRRKRDDKRNRFGRIDVLRARLRSEQRAHAERRAVNSARANIRRVSRPVCRRAAAI